MFGHFDNLMSLYAVCLTICLQWHSKYLSALNNSSVNQICHSCIATITVYWTTHLLFPLSLAADLLIVALLEIVADWFLAWLPMSSSLKEVSLTFIMPVFLQIIPFLKLLSLLPQKRGGRKWTTGVIFWWTKMCYNIWCWSAGCHVLLRGTSVCFPNEGLQVIFPHLQVAT